MSYDYSENILVQEIGRAPAGAGAGLGGGLCLQHGKLGKDGTFGRTSYREILLTRYFRQALQRLNPWLTSAQLDEAQKKMECRLSTASLMQINEEKYALIRDGIPVTVKRPDGRTEEKRAAGHRLPEPGQQPLSGHQGTENPRRSVPPPHGHRGLCQRNSPAVCGTEEEHGGCAGRLYGQLHRLSGHHPPPVLLQRLSHPLQRPGGQGGHAGQQVRVLPRVEAPQRAGARQRGPGDHAAGDLQKGELSGSAGKLHSLRPLRRPHRQDPGPEPPVSGCQRGGEGLRGPEAEQRQAGGLLAHPGQRQELLHGVPGPEDPAEVCRLAHHRGPHRPGGAEQADQRDF